MVASKWNWDLVFMLTHFAPRTLMVLFLNTVLILNLFKTEIKQSVLQIPAKDFSKVPAYIIAVHLSFLFLIVLFSHHTILFIGLFLLFIGFMRATKQYQISLSLREPLLVGFFLAGLIVIGGLQNWWLEPIIKNLSRYQLFLSAIGLTAFTDNAALTYLGSMVTSLDIHAKIALVSGSVIGGGLTLIANAPNPAGFGILRKSFEEEGFSSWHLFLWSMPLTIIAALIFILV
jgi:hypothetical protein